MLLYGPSRIRQSQVSLVAILKAFYDDFPGIEGYILCNSERDGLGHTMTLRKEAAISRWKIWCILITRMIS